LKPHNPLDYGSPVVFVELDMDKVQAKHKFNFVSDKLTDCSRKVNTVKVRDLRAYEGFSAHPRKRGYTCD
jgi:hypothetical protein